MPGFLQGSLSALISGSLPKFRQFTRNYHFQRGALLPGYINIKTVDDAVASVRRDFEIARSRNLLTYQPNVLTVIGGHEFSRNGYILDGKKVFDAYNPLDKSLHIAMAEVAQEIMRPLPEGIVYSPGTSALDTGESMDGKPVGENRGFMLSSGPQGDFLDFSKQHESNLDNWAKGIKVKTGKGPVLFPVTDVLGTGITRYIMIAVCLDYMKEVASGKVTFPISFDLGFCPSAGWPNLPNKTNADVLVNDAIDNPFNDGLIGRTRVWEPAMTDPVLGQVVRSLLDGNSVGAPALTAVGLMLLTSERLHKYFQNERVLKAVHVNVVEIDANTRIVETGLRKFPDPTDQSVMETAQAIENDSGSLVTAGLGLSVIEKAENDIESISMDLPWDYIQEAVARRIGEYVSETLSNMTDPFAKPVEDLIRELYNPSLRHNVQDRAQALVWEAIAANPKFNTTLSQIGEDGAKSMVDDVITSALVDRMAAESEGSTWLKETIKSRVLGDKAHFLAERTSYLESIMAEKTAQLSNTGSERAAQEATLAEVEKRLKEHPEDPTLNQRRDELLLEVKRLQEQYEREEEEERALETERDASEREGHENAEEKHNADESAKERSSEVFSGE